MKRIAILAILMFVGDYSVAGDLVPATSDDMNEFDKQVSQSADHDKPKTHDNRNDRDHDKQKKSNFGQAVSAEAHSFKSEGQQGSSKMGEWVSDQRRKNDDKHGADRDDDHGRSGSHGDDDRTSAPSNHGHGHGSHSSGN